MISPLKLLVGLGNPGGGYSAHRHNIGFMAIDAVAAEHGFPKFSRKFQGEISESYVELPPERSGGARSEKAKIILLKPQTYMNLSGESVGAAARFYKLPVQDIIVLHDELDLPLCKLRVKQGGGHGGHNGLKSIDQHLTPDYWRVRLGIGHPGAKELVTGHVLSGFSAAEAKLVAPWLQDIAASLPLLLSGDAPKFMNRLAPAVLPLQ